VSRVAVDRKKLQESGVILSNDEIAVPVYHPTSSATAAKDDAGDVIIVAVARFGTRNVKNTQHPAAAHTPGANWS